MIKTTTNFSLKYFVLKTSTQTWTIPFEIFPIYGFTIILEGHADYEINHICYHVSAGDLVFFPKGVPRLGSTSTGFKQASLDFDSSDTSISWPIVTPIEITEDLIKLLHDFQYNWLQQEDGWELLANGLFLQLLHLIQYGQKNNSNFKVEKMKRYIVDHYDKKMTTAEIAQVVALSPVYCGALFKKTMNLTIPEYITKIRIQKATLLLDEGQQTITEIAELCGFSDIFYFSKLFKKHMLLSPNDYRKKALPSKGMFH